MLDAILTEHVPAHAITDTYNCGCVGRVTMLLQCMYSNQKRTETSLFIKDF